MKTDNEIIEALEYCKENEFLCNNNCPLFKDDDCRMTLPKNSLDLIKRLRKENEKLNADLIGMRGACESYKMHYDNAQAEIKTLKIKNKQANDLLDLIQVDLAQDLKEIKNLNATFRLDIKMIESRARKEFAERLKEKEYWSKEYVNKIIFTSDIDNLLEEMEQE